MVVVDIVVIFPNIYVLIKQKKKSLIIERRQLGPETTTNCQFN